VESELAELDISTGDIDAAAAWSKAVLASSATGDFVAEKRRLLCAARICLATDDFDGCIEVLSELEPRLRQARQGVDLTRLLVSHALATWETERETALRKLLEAASIAQPEKMLLPFELERPYVEPLMASEEFARAADVSINGNRIRAFMRAFLGSGNAIDTPMRPFVAGESALSRKAAQSLTRREGEVYRLLADGLSDQEISQTLFISASTVHAHCARIYAKLGVSSRKELMG